MKILQTLTHRLLDKILVLLGTFYVLIPTSPMMMQYTYRDSGVFLYAGWRILNGALPYRDFWDHKPPVIHYLNALGLAMANGSPWGVWLLEWLGLSIAAFVGYKVVQKALGSNPALISTLLWMLTLVFVIQGGNLANEYILPLQFAALWLATTTLEKPTVRPWRWFLIGAMGAAAFFTKQTAIGIWISVFIFLVVYRVKFQKIKELVHEGLCFFGGAAAVCMAWVAFFALQGGLAQFWSAAFAYNFVYSSSVTGLLDRLKSVTIGITPLTTAGLLQLAGIGYLLGLILVAFRRNMIRGWLPLLAIGLFDLPIELLFIGVSGRIYPHYYMTILPALALFTGITVWAILSSRFFDDISYATKYVFTLGVAGVFFWTSFTPYRTQAASFRNVNEQHAAVSEILRNTGPEDKVLFWGAETAINFFSHRVSPTRFVYQYPLYTPGYANEQMIVEFLDDLARERPRWIVDTHSPDTPLYEFPIQTGAIRQRITDLQCHYRLVSELQEWAVYEYTSGDCSP